MDKRIVNGQLHKWEVMATLFKIYQDLSEELLSQKAIASFMKDEGITWNQSTRTMFVSVGILVPVGGSKYNTMYKLHLEDPHYDPGATEVTDEISKLLIERMSWKPKSTSVITKVTRAPMDYKSKYEAVTYRYQFVLTERDQLRAENEQLQKKVLKLQKKVSELKKSDEIAKVLKDLVSKL